MTLVQKFTEKYGISPTKLVEETNLEHFGYLKQVKLEPALKNYIEKEGLKIEVTDEFIKELVECFAEEGLRFPENVKAEISISDNFLIPNTSPSVPKSKGTLENFKEIVGTDDLRPVMMGVFVSEDGKDLVGTDAHKLVVEKNSEFSEYAGKVIDLKTYIASKGKKLVFVDGKFPNYNAVIPRENPNEVKNLDTYAFYNYAKSTVAVHKLVDQTLFNLNIKLPTVNGDGTMIASFNPVIALDVFAFALANGWSKFTLEYSTETRAYILNFGDGNIGLIMPIMNNRGGEVKTDGGEIMTPEEIMEKFKPTKSIKAPKPTAKKLVMPSAPVSSEPFQKYTGELKDTEYIHRSKIASITLTNGEVLGKNDVIDGFYRVNKKMATGGGIYSSDQMYVLKVYDLKGNLLDESKRFRERNERRAKEYAIYYHEDEMRDKYGSDLMFTVELAQPKMTTGGGVGELTEKEAQNKLEEAKKEGKCTLSIGIHGQIFMQTIGTGNFMKSYRNYKEAYESFLKQTQKMAHGGSMYADGGNMGRKKADSFAYYYVYASFSGSGFDLYKTEGNENTEIFLGNFKTIEQANKYAESLGLEKRPISMRFAHGGSMYADGGSIEGLKVGSKVGFLRPRIGRYEWAEVLSIDGDNVNLVVRHPKRKQWDNYFTETKQRIEKYINTVDENWHDGRGRTIMKIKYEHGGSVYADGGNMFETPIAKYKEVSGETRNVAMSGEVYESEIEDFVDYVHDFYEEEGFTKSQVKEAVDKYLSELDTQMTWGGGDSLDRERVYPKLAFESLKDNLKKGLITPSEFESMKKDAEKKYGVNLAKGGSMSSGHEVGDTVTFNSVLGGTKTGTIISKMGDEGFRVRIGDGFATIKKSAIV